MSKLQPLAITTDPHEAPLAMCLVLYLHAETWQLAEGRQELHLNGAVELRRRELLAAEVEAAQKANRERRLPSPPRETVFMKPSS